MAWVAGCVAKSSTRPSPITQTLRPSRRLSRYSAPVRMTVPPPSSDGLAWPGGMRPSPDTPSHHDERCRLTCLTLPPLRFIPSPTDTPASGHAHHRPGRCTGPRPVCDSLWPPKTPENRHRRSLPRRSTESRPQRLVAVPLESVAQPTSPPRLSTWTGDFRDRHDTFSPDPCLLSLPDPLRMFSPGR